MGICLSCFGNDQQDDEYRSQRNERTPLLQDPTAVLQQPRLDPTPEDQQRDQEALKRIVDRTAENLINIQSTFDRRNNGHTVESSEKSAHCKYLVERLRNKERSTAATSDPAIMSDESTVGRTASVAPKSKAQLVISRAEITNEERRLLDRSCGIYEEAVERLKVVKPVDDIVVKLTWEK